MTLVTRHDARAVTCLFHWHMTRPRHRFSIFMASVRKTLVSWCQSGMDLGAKQCLQSPFRHATKHAMQVSTSSTFKQLGLDSLDTVELVMALEEEFSVEIPDDDADGIHTVENAVEYFSNHPHAK